MTDRVYRFFAEKDEFLRYLKGSWSGPGTHAVASAEAGFRTQLRIAAKIEAILLDLRFVPREKISIFARLLGRKKNKPRGTPPSIPPLMVRAGETDIICDLDLAVIASDGWKITIQALENRKLYATCEKLPLLYFAGGLKKR